MPAISIIVPIYKGEKVLPKCVESVLAQTFSDWELLLIDDGSPDGSGALCDGYAAQDSRIRVFHKPNGGVSSARNLGMDEARGENILFVDADDWIAPEMCKVLWEAREAAGADTAGCAHWNVLPDGQKWREAGAMPAGVYGREAFRKGIVDRLLGQRLGKPEEVLNGFIWRFLFSRTLLTEHRLRFSGAYLEDELFLMEYFCLAGKLAMVDEPLYFYQHNPASVTRNYLPDYMDTFRAFLEAKRKLAARYGLEGDDPEWVYSTCWAGLLIAIGNEFAKSNPATAAEKRRRVEAYTLERDMADAIRNLRPRGMGRKKQLVADLVCHRQFGLLALLYQIKNR